ncbi:restriction endonuclease subunit S [Arthrobacter sp. C152]
MSDLTVRDLGALFDGPHATPKRIESGPYFLNIASLNGGRLELDQSDHVSETDFQKWTKRVEPTEGDLLFSYETRLGEAALMPADVRACLGRRMALIRPNRSVVNPKFLLYYYLSPGFQRTIEQHTIHGATVNRISLSTMGAWPVSIPSLDEQQAIAEVLGALDDKIADNTKLAATAKNLAEAYFLDALRGASEEAVLGDILALEYGKSLPASKRTPGNVDVYGSGGVSGTHTEALCENPGVVVGRKGTAGAVHWSRRPFFPIDTTFYVVPRSANISQIFSYFLLRTLRLDEMNNDSAVPGLNRNEAHASRIRVPSKDRLNTFTATATVLFDLIASSETENESLAATRDTLLPQLMSGKLRVKDAEKVLENAGV